jgi:drug/metabolite transporter (DMT)-like permease
LDHATSADGPARRTIDGATRIALLRLTLAILAISFTPILFRFSELGPTATAFHRTFLAVPIFAVWLAVERRRSAQRGSPLAVFWRWDAAALALGGVVFAANIVSYAWSVQLSSVANASLLSNLSPIFVALGGFLVFGDRVTSSFVAAMTAAVAGVAILSSDKLALGGGQILGDSLALVSAIFFAAYLMIVGRLRLRLRSGAIMLWVGLVASGALLAGAVAAGEDLLPETLHGWATLLGLAFVSYGIGQGLLTVALAQLGASFSAVSLLSLTVTSTLLGWALLGETLTVAQGIGGTIILGSILAAALTRR